MIKAEDVEINSLEFIFGGLLLGIILTAVFTITSTIIVLCMAFGFLGWAVGSIYIFISDIYDGIKYLVT